MTEQEYQEIRRTTRGATFTDGSNLRKLYDWIDGLRNSVIKSIIFLETEAYGKLPEHPTREEILKELHKSVDGL